MSVRVDRAEDHFGKSSRQKSKKKTESFQASIQKLKDDYGHFRMIGLGAYQHLAVTPTTILARDVAGTLKDLSLDDTLAVFGDLRGYVGGLPEGAPRRRILGADFIFRIPNDGKESEDAFPAAVPGSPAIFGQVISIEPLLIKDAANNQLELRPSSTCRVLQTEPIAQDALQEGMEVYVEGFKETVVLRPKGRTVMRKLFEANLVRVKSPVLRESEYRQVMAAGIE